MDCPKAVTPSSRKQRDGCQLNSVLYQGMRTLILENDLLKVGILVDKGTDIYQFIYKPTGTEYMWRSRQGVRDPRFFIPTIPTKLGAFLDYYEGGWQDLFPNADEPCVYKGAEIGVHGEICLMPWDYEVLLDNDHEIAVHFSVSTYRTPFRIDKIMRLKAGRPTLQIEETVTNEGREQIDFMWGQHPALGGTFLDEDCIISLPKCRVRSDKFLGSDLSRIAPDQDVEWPFITCKDNKTIDLRRVPSKTADCNDRVFIYDYSEGWYAITNKREKIGFAMRWEKSTFPYLLYWQSFGGWYGYPFYGTAYTMALEPRSSFPFPLSRVIEEKSQLKLAAGASLATRFQAIAYQGDRAIRSIDCDGVIEEDEQ